MSNATPLSLTEELVLVALDDDTGRLIDLLPFSLETAIAAALVMDLTLAGRIDTDPEHLFVLSPAPTGHAILDEVLARIAAEPAPLSSAEWLRRLAIPGPALRDRILDQLVQRGVLQSVEKRFLWVFKTRVYPPTSGLEEREVKSRVMTLLNTDDIPEARDAMLVGLLRATGIMERLLSETEYVRLRARIDQLSGLEEVSRALTREVAELYVLLASARAPMA
jgi:Golgi phosphoprotein 3